MTEPKTHTEAHAVAKLVKELYSAEKTHTRRRSFKRMLKVSPNFGRNTKREDRLLAA